MPSSMDFPLMYWRVLIKLFWPYEKLLCSYYFLSFKLTLPLDSPEGEDGELAIDLVTLL